MPWIAHSVRLPRKARTELVNQLVPLLAVWSLLDLSRCFPHWHVTGGNPGALGITSSFIWAAQFMAKPSVLVFICTW